MQRGQVVCGSAAADGAEGGGGGGAATGGGTGARGGGAIGGGAGARGGGASGGITACITTVRPRDETAAPAGAAAAAAGGGAVRPFVGGVAGPGPGGFDPPPRRFGTIATASGSLSARTFFGM